MSDSNTKIPKLKGSENWDIWHLRMEALLVERGYYTIFNPDPTPSGQAERNSLEFLALQRKAAALIKLGLEDGPLLQTRLIDSPVQLWSKLRELYEPKGFTSEFLLCRELFNTTLAKVGELEKYLLTIRRLTDDLVARDLAIPTKVIIA